MSRIKSRRMRALSALVVTNVLVSLIHLAGVVIVTGNFQRRKSSLDLVNGHILVPAIIREPRICSGSPLISRCPSGGAKGAGGIMPLPLLLYVISVFVFICPFVFHFVAIFILFDALRRVRRRGISSVWRCSLQGSGAPEVGRIHFSWTSNPSSIGEGDVPANTRSRRRW